MTFDIPLLVTLEDIEEKRIDSSQWYLDIKTRINSIYSRKRSRTCMACGKPFSSFELHHGIVPRGVAMGWRFPLLELSGFKSKSVRLILITNEINCVPLHAKCNKQNVPSPQEVWDYQHQFYSDDVIRWWYEEILPWKATPYRNF